MFDFNWIGSVEIAVRKGTFLPFEEHDRTCIYGQRGFVKNICQFLLPLSQFGKEMPMTTYDFLAYATQGFAF